MFDLFGVRLHQSVRLNWPIPHHTNYCQECLFDVSAEFPVNCLFNGVLLLIFLQIFILNFSEIYFFKYLK